ncbi:MAG: DUF3604 domain-containing protein [Alphaproteobacteria bacterium]|nr:DUF3604 domain-containing protein [Alphaproteobacteria bacterium]
MFVRCFGCVSIVALAVVFGLCTDLSVVVAAEGGSAAPGGAPEKHAFFGDMHVHTKISTDAYFWGSRLTLEDAYRFARGEAVDLPQAKGVALGKPLDFVALTDHSEAFAIDGICSDEDNPKSRSNGCEGLRAGDMKRYMELFAGLGSSSAIQAGVRPTQAPLCEPDECRAIARKVWAGIVAAANAANDPGRFTAFVAYEYSPFVPDGGMNHRNVIFANATVPDAAPSSRELKDDVGLWSWLEEACTGACGVITVPHNMNYSWGFAFGLETTSHKPYTAQDWARRAKLERLAEIAQQKGNSECAVGLGTTDEECGFEQIMAACRDGQETACAREGAFARNALKRGLLLGEELGLDPMKFGFIGSTDTHDTVAGYTPETAYFGGRGSTDDTVEKRLGPVPPNYSRAPLQYNPGGLAGVWAEENTRASLFAAMQRRETFATSGTRMTVRSFAGFGLPDGLMARTDWAQVAAGAGTPMGGELAPGTSESGAPVLLVEAVRDPASAGLDRIQIVKGFLKDGKTEERIYDVACAAEGCGKPAMDIAGDCRSAYAKGADRLVAEWRDPDFDPAEASFYYTRVLEMPTCRWSTLQALASGREIPQSMAPVIQERAWGSPVWYTP